MSTGNRVIKRIAILKGGTSAERKISLKTAAGVEQALDTLPFEWQSFDIEGPTLPLQELKKFDLVFIALHGGSGEDGSIQKILETEGIMYTGSDSNASGLAMNKCLSKNMFSAMAIPTSRFYLLNNSQNFHDLRLMAQDLRYPVVLKPNSEGSSIGISIVREESTMVQATRLALRSNNLALMEEYIDGFCLEVSILNDQALPIVHVIPENEFFDFKSKYESDKTQFKFDIDITDKTYTRVQKTALQAHRALGCRDFSRVDIILSKGGVPYVLEVNTLPGLTETSLMPKAAQKIDISFPQLIEKIIHLSSTRREAQLS